jgi:hypothetical protein
VSSAHDDTDDDELGLQAFHDMTQAVNRLGTTLQTTEQRNQVHAAAQTKAATEALRAAREALEASQNALEASKAQIRTGLLWAGSVALGVVLVAFVGGFRIGQDTGWDQGHAAGYASAISSNADASWANTPSGQRALGLDRLGSLAKLVECSQPGWRVTVQKGEHICFVDKAPDGKLYGWTIP